MRFAIWAAVLAGCPGPGPDPDTDTDTNVFPLTEVQIVATLPEAGAEDVPIDVIPQVEFDLPVYRPEGATDPALVWLTRDGALVPGGDGYAEIGYEAEISTLWGFIPSEPLAWETVYTMHVSGDATVEQAFGAGGLPSGTSWTFTTASEPRAQVVSTIPEADATEVATDELITVVFSKPIDPTTLGGNVLLTDRSGNEVYGELAASGITVTLDPYTLLQPDTTYDLTVTTGVHDTDGLPIASQLDLPFTTVGPLEITGMSPASGSVDVDIDGTVRVTFNVDIDPASVTNASVLPKADTWVNNAWQPTAAGTVQVSGNALTFTPTGLWQEYETNYTIYVDRGLRGVGGEALVSDNAGSFRTRFLDDSHNYTFHNLSDERGTRLGVQNSGFPIRARMHAHTGTEGHSRWGTTYYGSGKYDLWVLSYNSNSPMHASENGEANTLSARPTGGGVFTGQQWTFDSYGGHGNGWVQRAGESPRIYYVRNVWLTGQVMTAEWDATLGYTKVTMRAPQGNIRQLWWVARYN